ncbi:MULTISPECIES: flagellar basal body-associated protein FliL [Sediminibacillus]|uniref:flagellar basal body-associated protein FliL n=1 Tax=Sediminibacillus TaxID=482460 RepID=UPI001F3C8CB5|nr:flagellar basal body-associated protein FliL [Sediminibacillus terrae]
MSGKMIKTLIIVLLVLVIGGAAGMVFVLNADGEEKEPDEQSLDEMVENSVQTEEMSTDLEDGSFVRIQFQIVTDSEKAKEEVEKRQFQAQNILIKELAKMDREAFKTGLSDLEAMMKDKLNEVMQEGNIVDVYTIKKVLQ